MSTARANPGRWLFGAAPDLLLGCGLWYIFAFALMTVFGAEMYAAGGSAALPFLALLFGTPHYGGTLLRVYEGREERRAYRFFTVYVTIAIVALFALGVHVAIVGSLLLTVYLTWSPWHYTGQNYGLAVMFLRRREIELTPLARRLLRGSFVLSYVLTFLALHSGAEATDYVPLPYAIASYRFISLGLPSSASEIAFGLAAVGYAGCLLGAASALHRRASLRDLLPTGLLVASQAMWFTVPLVLRSWEIKTGIEPWESKNGGYYFLWIAIAHSVQYIWVTTYYAQSSKHWRSRVPYFIKIAFAGALAWTLPALIFAPGLLGRLPFDSGLGILIAATVNIHHFILDGAIWKLRDGHIARILLRTQPVDPATPDALDPTGRRPWKIAASTVIWATGAACFAIIFLSKWESEFNVRRAVATDDLEGMRTASKRLAWIGRDSPRIHMELGRAYARHGQLQGALTELHRSVQMVPSVGVWRAIGTIEKQRKNWNESIEAYEAALAIDPNHADSLRELGTLWLEHGEPERARDAFAKVVALDPDRKIDRLRLERAERKLRGRHAQ